MMTTHAFEAKLVQGGTPTTVRVSRDDSGELHLGSPEATSLLEQLLVYDLGEDADEATGLAEELQAVGTGRAHARTRAWNLVRLDIGPVTSELRLQLPDADQPVAVITRELHDVVRAYAQFLEATEA